MRREFYFIAALALLAIFIACGDDNEDPIAERIVGTWIQVRSTAEQCDDPDENQEAELTCDSLNCTQIIIGSDSSFVDLLIDGGDSLRLERIYYLVSDRIEVCDSDQLGVNCFNYGISIDKKDEFLTIEFPRDLDDGCLVSRRFRKR